MQVSKISIITVSYNAVASIEATILSVINQTYPNVEYIIIDGGSKDGTIDIIKRYEDKISYWISEPDNGIYDAMNKGLKMASGDWCIFMGADDIFYSSSILHEISHLFTDNSKIYYGDVILKSSNIRYMGEISSVYQLCHQNLCHQSIFYPKCIYKNKEYNVNHKIFADYVYNLELYHDNPNSFKYINYIITVFESSGISSNQDEYNRFKKERGKIIKGLFGIKVYYTTIMLHFLKRIHRKIAIKKNNG